MCVISFLEMEILSPTDDRNANRDRILALYSILNSVGLCSCDVEAKSYQQMLRERMNSNTSESR